MAGKGREPGFVMPESHRLKIANSNILRKLISAAEGKAEMGATQAMIGIALMKKVLPDLSAGKLEGTVEHSMSESLAEIVKAAKAHVSKP